MNKYMITLVLVVSFLIGKRLCANELGLGNKNTGLELTVYIEYHNDNVCKNDVKKIPNNRSIVPYMGLCHVKSLRIEAPGKAPLTYINPGDVRANLMFEITLNAAGQLQMAQSNKYDIERATPPA